MAVVLSELAKNADAAFRSFIVKEPEANLHSASNYRRSFSGTFRSSNQQREKGSSRSS
jgi:hypothetical protein